jgi:uncharacterized Zn-binding protein involved in type VI secretion
MASPARVGDSTTHGGSIIGPGVATVTIGGMPAAVLGDNHACPQLYPGSPGPPHAVTPFLSGSATVTIGGVPALTNDSVCICGAKPIPGDPTITIG